MHPSLLTALALAVAAPALRDPPRADPLVGEWECVSRTFNGTPDDRAGYRYVFTAGGGWTVHRQGVQVAGGPAAYAAGPGRDPAALDLRPEPARPDGPVLRAIYRVEGGVLTVCLTGGPERPTAFACPPGSAVVLYVFKRVKKD